MVTIKNNNEIELMRIAGKINYEAHQMIQSYLKQGISTKEINDIINKFIIEHDATPSFLGLYGFPESVCISINDEVVHGIPSKNRILMNGDIVSIDIGVCYKGYHSDSAATYPVGDISTEKKHLLEYTKEALYEGIKEIKEGVKLGCVSHKIEITAKKHKLGIVRELVGHGVGSSIHEDPDVPNYGNPKTGLILKSGMVLAIEPMLNLGKKDIWVEDNDWTISTQDSKPSAHFEHTVLVTKDGYEILTGE